MARFRLPPPFDDPEDDVVFPQSHGGNFRTAAVREEKPAVRSRRALWIAIGAMLVVVAAVGGLYVARVSSTRGVPLDHNGMTPPVTVTVPQPAPSPPVAIRNGRPPLAAEPFEITPGDGFVTLSTDVPARCTIRWVRFQTPVMDMSVPSGHHPAECISIDGTRHATFEVTILRNTATPRHIVLDQPLSPPQPPPPIGPSPLPRRAR